MSEEQVTIPQTIHYEYVCRCGFRVNARSESARDEARADHREFVHGVKRVEQ